MPESARLAYCFVQFFYQVQVSLLHSGNNKLGYPVTSLNGVHLWSKVDQSDLDFTTVISINGSRTVYDCHPMFYCQAAAWPHLNLKPRRYGNSKVGGIIFISPGANSSGSATAAATSIPEACLE